MIKIMNETLKEGLQVLIDSLKEGDKHDYYNTGICGELEILLRKDILSYPMFRTLLQLIRDNRPSETQHTEFFNLYPNKPTYLYWWPIMSNDGSTRTIRIAFLIKLKNAL